MVFPSIQFAVFFPIVFFASWLLMPYRRSWKFFILAASYVFYAAADPRFCLLLAGVTLVNQFGAVLIERANSERQKSWIVGVVVALDLLALGFFKYYNFFIDGWDQLLWTIGLGSPLPLLNIALPVGLSFFTFQAISYTVDVRRGICERSPTLDVAVYLAFFPHLVAGPIVRAREFLPQLILPRDPKQIALGPGIFLVCLGLVQKVVIADYLARRGVDPFFADPEAYAAPDAWSAVFAFAAQIYCDFAGYTNIAIGLALLLGFIFPQNFNRPYRSLNVREFWRRWHMTLSRFLRDFLYIPLGGSRGSRAKTARNLMITMLLGGLWHGAAWGFVLWGALHGSALVIEHLLKDRPSRSPKVLRWAGTFLFVSLAWIPFRAADLDTAWAIVQRLFVPGEATLVSLGLVLAMLVVFLSNLLPERPVETARNWFVSLRPSALAVGLAVTIALVAASIPNNSVPPFIYFQF
jgi:D-alanyl-lipoteichoic acid acyltransferase DltB (MBOAT superfamily)